MDLNNLTLIFFLIGFGVFFYKCFLLIINKYNLKLLIDDQVRKPQAFHTSPIPAVGGTGIFFSLLIVHFYFLLFKDIFFFSVERRLKFLAFSPKLQIGVSVSVIYNILINYD